MTETKGRPPLTKKFDGVRYHLFDYGYPNVMKAKGEAFRLRAKGYKVRVVRTDKNISIYRKI
jgi:hypothetical protein